MRKVWDKLGQIYCPPDVPKNEKLLSHAANPLAIHLKDDVYRIYYSGRDEVNRSSVGAVDVDIVRRCLVATYDDPFFLHGPPSSFYADGVSIGSCYSVDGQLYMLFMGWQSPVGGHWRGDIGRLKVAQDGCLELDCAEPFIASNPADPISLSYPWVEGDRSQGYQMWYGSTLSWDAGNGEMLHVIQHAKSSDGHHWERLGLAVPFELGRVQAFSRPTVLKSHDGQYEMWFSYRGALGKSYRIGYATSLDGIAWRLDLDNAGIDVSAEGWDSMMVEYPFVFVHKGEQYMLYNGNGHGKTGFGLAVRRCE